MLFLLSFLTTLSWRQPPVPPHFLSRNPCIFVLAWLGQAATPRSRWGSSPANTAVFVLTELGWLPHLVTQARTASRPRKLLGFFLDTSRNCPGKFPEMSQKIATGHWSWSWLWSQSWSWSWSQSWSRSWSWPWSRSWSWSWSRS
jgi:hypothetical protein